MNYCLDCGSKVYNGHCVNCHEETYIAEQSWQNDEPTAFSLEFREKLVQQAIEAKEILKQERGNERFNSSQSEASI